MRKESIKNITSINYTYQSTNNKFYIDKFSTTINSTVDPNDIKVLIDPHAFNNKHVFSLDHTNEKWFMNLSNSVIPRKVSTLLQLGQRFSLSSDIS